MRGWYLTYIGAATTPTRDKLCAVPSIIPIGTEVIKVFLCSTQLSTKFILLINVIMPTIVGILTFISMINAASKQEKFFVCRYFRFMSS